jgi:hypothetical protein
MPWRHRDQNPNSIDSQNRVSFGIKKPSQYHGGVSPWFCSAAYSWRERATEVAAEIHVGPQRQVKKTVSTTISVDLSRVRPTARPAPNRRPARAVAALLAMAEMPYAGCRLSSIADSF